LRRRIGLRQRVLTQAGAAATDLGSARRVAKYVVAFTLLFEVTLSLVLWLRFWVVYDQPVGDALWSGVFHTVSAFNNAGFGLYPDNLVRFDQDAVVSLGIAFLIISGGLGFPVWLELRDRPFRQGRRLSLHARLMLAGTAGLLAFGFVAFLAFEWSNPATLGQFDAAHKVLPSFFQAVTPRTAGFNTLDYSQMREETWLTQMMLMFVGGGPASTAGGVKVTTFVVLLLAVAAEARGVPDTNAFGRRIPTETIRLAFVVAFIAMNAIVVGTLVVMLDSSFEFTRVLFECISAFGTVGLSTGITFDLPDASKYVLVVIMFLGRTGPYTLALALALRQRPVRFRYAEERPIIG
jgi:Trk-type K+ transport system membrane component